MSISPVGTEQLVNVGNTTGAQQQPKVASDSAGNYVVTWTGVTTGAGTDIYAQRYNAAGATIGGPWVVNSTPAGDQSFSDIAMNASGTFVVTWVSTGQDGSGDGVYAQRYDSSGVAQGSEFRVNVFTNFDQNLPSVGIDSAGNFVVAWQSGTVDGSGSQDGDFTGVYARRYAANGTALDAGDVLINTATDYFQGAPSVAMNPSGSYAIAWTDIRLVSFFPTILIEGDVYIRRYNSAGVVQSINGSTNPFRVNNTTDDNQVGAQVAMDDTGNFVVVWGDDRELPDLEAGRHDVYMRRFSSTGAVLSSEAIVNQFTNFDQYLSTVAMDGNGNFIVTWFSGDLNNANNNQDGSSLGVYARRYTSAGTADGNEFRVNTFTTGSQSEPQLALNTAGQAVIVWTSVGQDGSLEGVYSQQYASPNLAPIVNTGGPYSVTEGQSLVLDASGSSDPEGQALTFAWDLNNDNNFNDATGAGPSLTWAQLAAFGITDGPNSVANARVRVSDPFGGVTTTAFTINVINAAPTAGVAGPGSLARDASGNFTLTATDSATPDQAAGFTFTIDWNGDGSDIQIVNGASGLVVAHTFTTVGARTVKVTATDKDGGVSSQATLAVSVSAVQVDINGNLVWTGTAGADHVQFEQLDATTIQVTTTLDNGLAVNFVETISGVTGIVDAQGLAGDDTLDASLLTTTAATLDGGIGNNTLYGGGANDILIGGGNYGPVADGPEGQQGNNIVVGGAGDDTIYGNSINGGEGKGGNNILLGGTGNDTIYGNWTDGGEGGGFNIIVGGADDDTLYDYKMSDGAEGKGSIMIAGDTSLGVADLNLVMAEWASGHTYAARVANILGPGAASRLNGNAYLQPGTTVSSDAAVNQLWGATAGGLNWYWYAIATDAVNRSQAGETHTNY
ncbi:MAG: PKD domain-containing protein [Pirellulales bacterium]